MPELPALRMRIYCPSWLAAIIENCPFAGTSPWPVTWFLAPRCVPVHPRTYKPGDPSLSGFPSKGLVKLLPSENRRLFRCSFLFSPAPVSATLKHSRRRDQPPHIVAVADWTGCSGWRVSDGEHQSVKVMITIGAVVLVYRHLPPLSPSPTRFRRSTARISFIASSPYRQDAPGRIHVRRGSILGRSIHLPGCCRPSKPP
jgi:hypothetical protein